MWCKSSWAMIFFSYTFFLPAGIGSRSDPAQRRMMSDALRPNWRREIIKPLFLSLISLIRICLSHHSRSSAPGHLLFLQSSRTSTVSRWSLLPYETSTTYQTAHENIFLSLIRPSGLSDMGPELWRCKRSAVFRNVYSWTGSRVRCFITTL